MAKSLLKLFPAVQMLSKSPRILGTIRLNHSESQANELATVDLKTPSEAKKLFQLFTNDDNPINLIVNIEENKEIIDGRHVVTALTSMYKFYEKNNYPLENVTYSPQFTKMCNYLNKHIRTLEMPQRIQALKILNLFKVQSSTTVMQNILQTIRVTVNDLHPHEIYYLTFLLRHMKSTHLGNAIYTALPEIFEARIKSKLDVENIVELSNALKYATYHTKSGETIAFLLQHIRDYKGQIDTSSAIKIFQSLCKVKRLADDFNDVLLRIIDVIIKDIDDLNEAEVMFLISEACTKVIRGYNEFYDPIFLDELLNQVVKNDCGLEHGITVLGKINLLSHIHLPLLEYLTAKIQNNPHIFAEIPKSMAILIQGLANANYKPDYWENLKKAISENYKKLPDHVTLSYLALHLAALDHCDISMIETIFTMDQNPERLSYEYRKTLCELYQTVKTLYPEYTGPWPKDEIVDSFKTFLFTYPSTDSPLKPALNKLLGDPACLKTNVRTNLGHLIDHLVLLRNGSPITFESNAETEDPDSSCFVEDLNIPQDCKKVAICLLPWKAYGRNIAIPKPIIRTKKKTLEALSFKVVYISENTWSSMPDNEVIPYLRHLIGVKNKAPKNENNDDISSSEAMKAST